MTTSEPIAIEASGVEVLPADPVVRQGVRLGSVLGEPSTVTPAKSAKPTKPATTEEVTAASTPAVAAVLPRPIELATVNVVGPGDTGVLFYELKRDAVLLGVEIEPSCALETVSSDDLEIEPTEGETWAEVFRTRAPILRRGQYAQIVVKNNGEARIIRGAMLVRDSASAGSSVSSVSRDDTGSERSSSREDRRSEGRGESHAEGAAYEGGDVRRSRNEHIDDASTIVKRAHRAGDWVEVPKAARPEAEVEVSPTELVVLTLPRVIARSLFEDLDMGRPIPYWEVPELARAVSSAAFRSRRPDSQDPEQSPAPGVVHVVLTKGGLDELLPAANTGFVRQRISEEFLVEATAALRRTLDLADVPFAAPSPVKAEAFTASAVPATPPEPETAPEIEPEVAEPDPATTDASGDATEAAKAGS